MQTQKGCMTCRVRKVRCDRGLPVCQQCVRARRECRAYEMRLSWPRNNDKKRAITGASTPLAGHLSPQSKLFFVNTTWQEMVRYRHLSLKMVSPAPAPYSSDLWKGLARQASCMELVQYFHDVAYRSLVTFDASTPQFRDVLIRLALAHKTAPGLALFHAMLAFSSLHRSGLHQQAVELKISALRALSTSAREVSRSSVEATQHVAASMLLGAFEITTTADSSGEWVWYVRGAMDTVQATRLEDQPPESDLGHILSWVYYQNAVSRFSMHHWRREPLSLEATGTEHDVPRDRRYPALTESKPTPPSPNPAHAIWNLFSEACDTILDPWDPRSQEEEYQGRLRTLQKRIESLQVIVAAASATGDSSQLYQMATQIYLMRASLSPWESSAGLDALVDEAFLLPCGTPFCPQFFPLFILGCEARTDEQRARILSLIENSEKESRVRSMKALRSGIQSAWVQRDLHADCDLLPNYIAIMSSVINSSNTPPSFV